MNLLGIDTGGTFTDFVLFDGRGLRIRDAISSRNGISFLDHFRDAISYKKWHLSWRARGRAPFMWPIAGSATCSSSAASA